MIVLTADHGQTPYPEETGAWPIGGAELARDVNAHFDADGDDVPLADRVTSPGIYVNRSELADNEVTLQDVAKWVARYTVGETIQEGVETPAVTGGRLDRPLFDATLAGARLGGRGCSLR